MKRTVTIFRGLFVLIWAASLLSPLSAVDALAQDEAATGGLTIILRDDAGNLLPGGSFRVTDANGVQLDVRDDADGADGYTNIAGLAAGDAAVLQIGGPETHSYDPSAISYASVPADGVGELRLTNPLIVQPAQIVDTDGDGTPDDQDSTPNGDNDGDGIDNLSDPTPDGDPDDDGDGIADRADNCRGDANPDQIDTDGDGHGDACDLTPDGDPTEEPATPEPDADADGVPDATDNCADASNEDQLDTDGDGQGDVCDVNDDNDSHPDASDNCLLVSNKMQLDRDDDGIGNACDDTDNSESGFVIQSHGGPEPGDITITHRAADPDTYNRASGTGDSPSNVVTSLQPFNDLLCGDHIIFYDIVEVESGSGGPSTITITNLYGQTTTSGGLVGFLPGDISVSLLGGDGDETLGTSITGVGSNSQVVSTVGGVEFGETIIVRIDAIASCRDDEKATGTIQVDAASAEVVDHGSISLGNQTIPLSADNFIQPLLVVDKQCPTVTSGPVGTVLSYPVTISNTGNIDLALSFVESRPGGTFTPAFPVSLADGAIYTGTFQSTATITDSTNGHVNNTLTVTGNFSDGDVSGSIEVGDTALCPFTVTAPNVVIEKVASPVGPVEAGNIIGFNITVRNIGAAPATGVSFTDDLPDGPAGNDTDWNEVPNQTLCTLSDASNQVLNCSGINLAANNNAAGGPDEFTVRVETDTAFDDDCGVYNNTVTLTGAFSGSASASVTVTCPDVDVNKTPDGQTINAGQTATFTIVVTNIGTGNATNVAVSDNLPTGVWNVTIPAGVTCGANIGPTTFIDSGNVACTIASLAAGAGNAVTITASRVTTPGVCVTLNNSVTVTDQTGGGGDADSQDSDSGSITVICSDVSVTKTATIPTRTPGQVGTFTIVVTVGGSGTSNAVTLTDTLPAGFSIISAVRNPGGTNVLSQCTPLTGAVTCSFGNRSPGTTITVVVQGTVTAQHCADIPNTANVSSTNDTNATNNQASATIVVNCPDVRVTKTPDGGVPGTIDAGENAVFSFLIENIGDAATNVTLTDALPDGVDWNFTTTPAGWTCSVTPAVATTGQTLNCSVASFAAGGSVTVVVTASTTAANCGTLDNPGATVSTTGDVNTANNTDGGQIIVRCPDVAITKVVNGSTTVTASDPVSYTITVRNLSTTATATNVDITDTLPAGISWLETPDTSCTITGGNLLECLNLTLTPDDGNAGAGTDEFSVTVTGTTDNGDCGTLTNTATVTADGDTNPNNNSSAAPTVTVQCPNLTLVKTPDGLTINAGQTATYSIVVTNNGPGAATGVTVNDTLPGGTWTVTTPDGTCNSPATGTFTCNLGTIAAGNSETITVTRPTTAADCVTLTNTATVAGTNEDPALDTEADDPDQSDTGTIIVNCPNVTVTKSGNGPITAGDTATFTITVSNAGPGTATGVVLTDDLPNAVLWDTIVEAGTGGGPVPDCSFDGSNNLTCTAVDLDTGEGFTVTVSGPTDNTDCGTLTNTALLQVANDGSVDPIPSNQAQIVVNCPDILVTKLADAGNVSAGTGIGFTITVTNLGPGIARDVTLSDLLPANAGLSWTVGAPTPLNGAPTPTCGVNTGTLTCGPVDLDPTEGFSVRITSPTTAATCGQVANTAIVTATNENPNGIAPNSAIDTVQVHCPDVTVAKSTTTPTVNSGDPVSFTIVVRNLGAGTATTVTVNDPLPDGVDWDTATAGCSILPDPSTTGQTLDCTFASLAANDGGAGGADEVTITVTGTVPDAFCGPLTNLLVTVDAANEADTGPTSANNTDGPVTITVQCPDLQITKEPDTGDTGSSISAGDTATFTIVVSNPGPGLAQNVTLSDILPAGSGSWTVVTNPPALCPATATGTLNCTLGDIAAGNSVTITLSKLTTPALCGLLNNSATADADNDDAVTDTGAIEVRCPDVVIEKEPDAPSDPGSVVSAGDPISFTITVRNLGTGEARGVQFNDTLPPGIDWDETSDPGNNCSLSGAVGSEVLACGPTTLAPNNGGAGGPDEFTVTVTGTTDAADCGDVINTVTVSVDNEATATLANNSDTATVSVQCSNVTITKSGTSPITAGDTAAFTITVTNTGPGTATGVVLTDDLPNAVVWDTVSPLATGGLPAAPTCILDGNNDLSCGAVNLAAGQGFTVTVSGPTDNTDCGTLPNTALLQIGNDGSPDPIASNQAQIVVNCPDVTVAKSTTTPTVNSGDPVSYTIVVTNIGAGTATTVTVNDPLPDGVNWNTATSGCSITPDQTTGQTLNCSFATLAPGAGNAITITITGTVPDAFCGPLTNLLVTVDAVNEANTGPATENNTDGAVTITVQCPNLTIVKDPDLIDGDPGSIITAGDTATFTIVVTNTGPGLAQNVVVDDGLPGGSWTVTTTAGTCDNPATGSFTCQLGDIAAGDFVTITVSRLTTAADCGRLNNIASAEADNFDGEVSDIANIEVLCPDVVIDKEPDAPIDPGSVVSAGDPISFTITVRNVGPGEARGVQFNDSLPAGIAWSEASDPGNHCTLTGAVGSQVLACGPTTLAPNNGNAGGPDEFTVTVTGTTDAADCGNVVNTVTVSADNEANTGNNSDTGTIIVFCPDVTVEKSTTTPTVNSGDPVSITIVVRNIGAGTATTVTVGDPLPDGVDWDTTTAGCSILPDPSTTGQTLSCTFASLTGNDNEVTITVTGTVPDTFCGPLTNLLVAVDAANEANTGPAAENNTDGPVTITVNCPDLTIQKEPDAGDPGSVISAGETAIFTITIDNIGAGTATDVGVLDFLPDGIPWQTTHPNCFVLDFGGDLVNQGLICSNLGDLEPDDPPIVITITGVTDADDCGLLDNTAEVNGSNEATTGPTSLNNSDTGQITVNCPGLDVDKTPDGQQINAGETATYQITVDNTGLGTAFDVTLTDTLPDAETWDLTFPAGVTCEGTPGPDTVPVNGSFTCELGDIAPDDPVITLTLSRVTTAADCRALTNQAEARSTNGGFDEDTGSIVVNCPDVTVAKSTTTPTVNSGDPVSFTIVVRNLGAGTATTVTVTDPLPDGVDWNTTTAGCSVTPPATTVGQTLSCSFASLAANDNAADGPDEVTITVTGTVPDTFCGPLTNLLATVDAANEANTAPASTNNTAGPVTITVNCPNLTITKEPDLFDGDPGSIITAGDPATFTIVVTNTGSGLAQNVVVEDGLPGGTWTVTTTAGTCDNPATGSFTCQLGDITAGNSVTITVSRLTTAADCGRLNNNATADADNFGDPVSDIANIEVLCPDVVIDKEPDAPNDPGSVVSAGDPISFTITVRNVGTGEARGVQFNDSLPAGIDWTETSDPGNNCSLSGAVGSEVLACGPTTLAPNNGGGGGPDEFTVTVSGTTDAADCSDVINTVTVSADNEANTGNNSNTATVTVNCPGLDVDKTPDGQTINAGETATYQITVDNTGSGTAFGVTLTDTLPDAESWNVTFPAGVTCEGVPGPDTVPANSSFTCALGTIAPSDPVITITISRTTTAADCITLTNQAQATSTNGGFAEDTGSIVVNCPDVTVEKRTDTPIANSGDSVSFSILVTNNGPGLATTVTVTDPLPDGVDWNTATPGCSILPDPATTGQVLSCTFASLGVGAGNAIKIIVTGTVPETFCGPLVNQATVDAANEANTGPAAQNNQSARITITVNCPNVRVVKTADLSPVNATDSIGFLITVTNDGPGRATNVMLSDTLPTNAGLSWTIAGGTGAALCSINLGVLSCNFLDLEEDDVLTVHITSPTTPATCGRVENTATITVANELQVNQQDNSSTAFVDVQCPNVEVEKRTDTPTVNSGDAVSYAIAVSNSGVPGTGTAYDVVLTDDLPDGVTWSVGTVTPTGGLPAAPACVIDVNGDLACDPVDLAPGQGFAVVVTGTVDADDCPGITNQAAVQVANDATTDSILSENVGITVNCPNVTVVKQATPGTISAGQDAVYTITVANAGPGTAYGVDLDDDLPNSLSPWSVVSVTPNPDPGGPTPACVIDGSDNLDCAPVNVPAGQGFTVTVNAPTTPADCGEIVNQAAADVANDLSRTAILSNESPIAINCSELFINKVEDGDPVSAGDQIGFTITVRNDGDGTAFAATLTDNLPGAAGLDWNFNNVTAIGGGPLPACGIAGAVGSEILTCGPVDLDTGEGFSVHVFSATTPASCALIQNTATVTLRTGESAPANADVRVECPSVLVTKTTPDDTVSAGENAVFVITVVNNGAGIARNVNLADTLPAGPVWSLTLVDPTPDTLDPGCTLVGNALECGPVDLDTGEGFAVTVTGVTDAADCGPLPNTATVTVANEPANDTAPNQATATVTVNCPDLEVTKTALDGEISSGDPITFTITVINHGPGDAFNVDLTDNLPPGIDWTEVPASDSDGICAISGAPGSQVLTCSIDMLPAGESFSVQVTGVTDAADCGLLENTATVTLDNEPADDQFPNEATGRVQIDCPNVTVTKDAGDDVISAGDTAQFTIRVQNAGPGVATGVVLTDDLPAGIAWAIDNVAPIAGGPLPNCVIDGNGDLACSAVVLDPGEGFLVQLSGLTDAADCRLLTNQAAAQVANDGSTEPVLSPSATIDVLCPDVRILKEALDGEINASETATFRITVTNDGPGQAKGVEFFDTLPAGIDWTETNDPSNVCVITGAVGSEVLHCGPVDLADDAFFTVTVSGPTGPEDCGEIINTVTVSATNEPTNVLQNNTSTATIDVLCPDVEVIKTTPDDDISSGEDAVFVITVVNNGAGTAFGVNLTDTLPAGPNWSFVITDTTPDGLVPGCSLVGNDFECGPVDLASGAGFVITITDETDADDCRALVNTATVTAGNEATGTLDDNTSAETITVRCPDLDVDKTGPASVNAGEAITFTVTVTNTGLGDAFDVVLTDNLPAGIDWIEVAGSDPQNLCSISGPVGAEILSCSIPVLPAGEDFSVQVTGLTDAADCVGVSNTATVEASNEGVLPAVLENNQATARVDVNCPDVDVTKTTTDGEISAGDTAQFTIRVQNNGEGVATGVVLTDDLPSGIAWNVDFVTSIAGGPTPNCSTATGDLVCDPASLDPGEGFEVRLSGLTDAADCRTLTNQAAAQVANDGSVDPISSNQAEIDVLCPDVRIVKQALDGEVDAGDPVSFAITVTNDGPGQAKGVEFFDTLPGQVDWTETNDPSNVCVITGAVGSEVLHCGPVDLAADAFFTVTVTGTAGPEDCGTIENTVTVSADNEPQTALQNNSSSDDIDVLCPDVSVTKTTPDDTVSAGENAVFVITVVNNGDGLAKNVNLTDTLPAGPVWSFVVTDTTPDGLVPGCSLGGNDFECGPVDLASGEGFVVTITGITDHNDCRPLVNTATVTVGNEATGDAGDNQSGSTVTVDCPDLEIEKTALNGTISAGETATFTITVTNNGPGQAFDVTLNDTLPAGIVWTENPDTLCTITGLQLSCAIGTLDDDEPFSVTVEGVTGAADCGTLDNQATADASNDDPITSETASVDVNCPDLTVVKEAGDGEISAGEDAVFTITVNNSGAAGTGTAFDVTLTDNLPAGIDWAIDSSDEPSCEITGAVGSEVLSCGPVDLDSGEGFSVTISGATDAADCGTLENTATVDASNLPVAVIVRVAQIDSNTAAIEILCPDLEVEKSAASGTISAGEKAIFTITVTNNGPGQAFGVTLNDTLPSGIVWTENPNTAECSITGLQLSCTIGTLDDDEPFSVTVEGITDAADCGTLQNQATADASNDDPVTSETAEIAVNCPNLTIVKAAVDDTISSTEDAEFTITVTNLGPGIAFAVTLTDDLPDGLPWTTTTQGCSIADTDVAGDLIDQVLSCSFGDLNPTDDVVVTVSGETDPADCGNLINTATADASNSGPVPSDPATIAVLCQELTIEKTAGDGTISAGETASYTITVGNTGEGEAFNVTIADTLPAGIVWTENPDTTECSITGLQLACTVGTILPDESFSVTVEGVTDAADCGTLENQATADASNDDPVTSDLIEIRIDCPDLSVVKEAEFAEINAGEDAVFIITVTNNGAGTAFDVTLTDNLPAAIDWQIDSSDEPSCEITGAVGSEALSCGPVDLVGEGGSFTVTVSATTGAADCGALENTATVDASNLPLADIRVAAIDSNTATMEINCPDVTVEKSGNGPITSGEQAVFTITLRNTGDGDALDVELSDDLPAGLAWTIDPAVEGCAIANGTLDCAFDVVAAGATITIVVKAQTATGACDDLVNTVQVGAGNEPDDATANNSDSATIVVECDGGAEITKTLCVTTSERAVAFLVIEPDGAVTGEDHHHPKTCKLVKDVEFTIDGDNLADPITVKTGADGKVGVLLTPGDYTITEKSTGASAAFSVIGNGTTLIRVFNFKVERPAATPVPVTDLPNTGAGAIGALDSQSWLILLLTMVVFGGAAYALRRRAT